MCNFLLFIGGSCFWAAIFCTLRRKSNCLAFASSCMSNHFETLFLLLRMAWRSFFIQSIRLIFVNLFFFGNNFSIVDDCTHKLVSRYSKPNQIVQTCSPSLRQIPIPYTFCISQEAGFICGGFFPVPLVCRQRKTCLPNKTIVRRTRWRSFVPFHHPNRPTMIFRGNLVIFMRQTVKTNWLLKEWQLIHVLLYYLVWYRSYLNYV